MKLLDLPLCYMLAVHEVLKQGRWKSSGIRNAAAYIRLSAKREAVKMDIVGPPADDAEEITFSQLPAVRGEDGEEMSYQDAMDYRAYDSDTRLYDSDEYYDEAGHLHQTVSDHGVSSTITSPDDEYPDARMKIDWDKVADAVHLLMPA